jgi:hypothetical protein
MDRPPDTPPSEAVAINLIQPGGSSSKFASRITEQEVVVGLDKIG